MTLLWKKCYCYRFFMEIYSIAVPQPRCSHTFPVRLLSFAGEFSQSACPEVAKGFCQRFTITPWRKVEMLLWFGLLIKVLCTFKEKGSKGISGQTCLSESAITSLFIQKHPSDAFCKPNLQIILFSRHVRQIAKTLAESLTSYTILLELSAKLRMSEQKMRATTYKRLSGLRATIFSTQKKVTSLLPNE